MRLTADLQAAIGNLYTVFATYPLRTYTDPCLHCHTEEEERLLHDKPLRELTADDLRRYAYSSIYTWGNEEDFKHFLPRLFELLIVNEGSDLIDPEALFTKLPSASWTNWPETERTAIRMCAQSAWLATFSSSPEDLGYFEIEDWLCTLAQFEEDLEPYLDAWLSDDSEGSYRTLAYFILNDLNFSGKAPMGYWEQSTDQWHQLTNWFLNPAVRKKLERGVERWADTEFGSDLYDAATLLPFR